ncbi:30S ribosomal protein S16 [Atopobium minutum]|nr:30S ribosomal protein S16 [Atopobium minutum]
MSYYYLLLYVALRQTNSDYPCRIRLKRSFTLAVKIRLARHGAKKRPFYRVVVADGRMPRDGRYIELVGRYNPLTTPKTIEIDLEKVDAWVAKGAQPTNAVAHLIDIARGAAPEPSKKDKKSKKQIAKDAAAAEEAAAAAESAE